MIITVTLNAAIDKSLSVPNFRLGRRHRTVEQRTMAGGKGVNIARALKALGQPVIATGLAGGATGTHIVEQLTEEAILNDFVRIRDESRTNTSVLDPTNGEQTEVNERGPSVSEQEVELFRDKLLYLARGAAIVVLAGSLPRGVEPDLYATLIRELQKAGVTTVIDTDGDPLTTRSEPSRMSSRPTSSRPRSWSVTSSRPRRNALGRPRDRRVGPARGDHDDGRRLCRRRLDRRQIVLARARTAPRDPIAKRGSGDAFLAGYVAARYEGRSPDQCLRFGVACGAESTGRLGAGLIDPKEARRLLGEVEGRWLRRAAGAEVAASRSQAGSSGARR